MGWSDVFASTFGCGAGWGQFHKRRSLSLQASALVLALFPVKRTLERAFGRKWCWGWAAQAAACCRAEGLAGVCACWASVLWSVLCWLRCRLVLACLVAHMRQGRLRECCAVYASACIVSSSLAGCPNSARICASGLLLLFLLEFLESQHFSSSISGRIFHNYTQTQLRIYFLKTIKNT